MSADRRKIVRCRLHLEGVVQGVGLRPAIARLATELHLTGFVRNDARGVEVELQGPVEDLEAFRRRVVEETAVVHSQISIAANLACIPDESEFAIVASTNAGRPRPALAPDLAMCDHCRRELYTPHDRRFRYPFISCAGCGPRYSIADAVPFDRERTAYRDFPLCNSCAAEYRDPSDRRFHAQTTACAACGPALSLCTDDGTEICAAQDAVETTVDFLRQGKIVAVKGIGGFHLLVDATCVESVGRLRRRKGREAKPFAVLCSTLDVIREYCRVSTVEEQTLLSSAAPIVLLEKLPRCDDFIAGNVAPGTSLLGCLLPYSPLHDLIATDLSRPLVATSGNRSEELLCTGNREAFARLRGIADYFLIHNRAISRPVEDSVVRVVLNRAMILRRARGYTAATVSRRYPGPPILAVGGQQKSAVAFATENEIYIGPHLGDLASPDSLEVFRRTTAEFTSWFATSPAAIACDLHPDYASTQFAEASGRPLVRVQHHFAHILACCAEHEIEGPVLGVAWDGAGRGMDGTIWGGEFLAADAFGFERVAHLRAFPLPGASQAVREPRRAALGLLTAAFGPKAPQILRQTPLAEAFSPAELAVLRRMLASQSHSPLTTSAGRLFDGVAAILGLRMKNQFEGQAAGDLEFAAARQSPTQDYALPLTPDGTLDWAPMLADLLADLQAGVTTSVLAANFHHALAAGIVRVAERTGRRRVILTGGCFQNAYLLTCTVERLRAAGFEPFWHQTIPPNDGGLALGQIIAASARLSREK